jgi:hypothetical protein
MKLIRFGVPGAEKPGLILGDGARVDASAFGSDWDERFLGTDGLARLGAWAREHAASLPRVPESERLGPCIPRPSKIVCIGLNYADHARETGAKIPDEPIIFFKATTALSGPNDDLVLPRGSVKTDWEVELAVVIGRRARYVSREERPPTSPATRSTTTTPSGRTSSSAGASGRRARARTPSPPSAPSSRPRTRSAT